MKINLLHLSATPALATDETASAEERTVCLRGGTRQFTQDVTAFMGKLKTLEYVCTSREDEQETRRISMINTKRKNLKKTNKQKIKALKNFFLIL